MLSKKRNIQESRRLSQDHRQRAHWLSDWVWEQYCVNGTGFYKRTLKSDEVLQDCLKKPVQRKKTCRNHCYGICPRIETNTANFPACTIYLVSTKHKKPEPMWKRFYQEKGNIIAHFKTLCFAVD